jgi:hypothetical protein
MIAESFRVARASRVLAMASHRRELFSYSVHPEKACFGETPKPARETRALPNPQMRV